MLAAMTSNFPVKAGFALSDRNRADLDWKGGKFTWRYRNKLTIDRTFSIHSYRLIPYVAAEVYYVNQYNKWSTTSLYVGGLFPPGKHIQFDSIQRRPIVTCDRPEGSNVLSLTGLARLCRGRRSRRKPG
jgi:hypothetical protein